MTAWVDLVMQDMVHTRMRVATTTTATATEEEEEGYDDEEG